MPSEQTRVTDLLNLLADPAAAFSLSKLWELSDLHGAALQQFRASFPAVPLERRRWLLHNLVELAEASFEVSFEAIFRTCLDDADAVLRALALDALWEDSSPDLVPAFLGLLRSDPAPKVRAAAAGALGRFVLAGELAAAEPQVEAHIVEQLLAVWRFPHETAEVRRRALESMSYCCRPEVGRALELAYYDDDEGMRQSAILGMGRTCDRRWAGLLIQELASQSPAIRYEAALACGEQTLRSAVVRLGRLVYDDDRQVCQAAIWALGQIGGPRARELLLDAYEDADDDLEAALDEALAEQALAGGSDDSPDAAEAATDLDAREEETGWQYAEPEADPHPGETGEA